MKYYHTNIVLQHETKLGFDFHILTRTLDFYLDFKKSLLLTLLSVCWDVLYQILRGKEKCVVITTKESRGLISMCYLHI